MKVLDLFSGLGGWSQPFIDRGHETFLIDWDTSLDADLHKDIRNVTVKDIPWEPDIILASPPCEKFSVMTVGRYWNKDNTPKRVEAEEAIDIVKSSLNLIHALNPKFWVMENPVGKLRKLEFMQEYHNQIITYCSFGEAYMKPTDLWGQFPPSLVLPPKCKNGNPDHLSAPRGSKKGVQSNATNKFKGGMIDDMVPMHSKDPRRLALSALRAKIPYKLAEVVCVAAEKDL